MGVVVVFPVLLLCVALSGAHAVDVKPVTALNFSDVLQPALVAFCKRFRVIHALNTRIHTLYFSPFLSFPLFLFLIFFSFRGWLLPDSPECSHCKVFLPLLARLESTRVSVATLSCVRGADHRLCVALGVTSVPAVMLFHNGSVATLSTRSLPGMQAVLDQWQDFMARDGRPLPELWGLTGIPSELTAWLA